ncbi:MAG: sensor histidine kinase [Candidatus Omnitrophica bacterium]|nr:sensor histidine kinase [Candidatus Omnitrophota bacterium]
MTTGLNRLFSALRNLAVKLKPKKNFLEEKLLLLSFSLLIALTFLIGVVGISRMHGLSKKIEDLGRHNLRLETAVLEMRIKNANFAMGVRNYVFWRASRYLGAVAMARNTEGIFESADDFKDQLKVYRDSSYLDQQRNWADEVSSAFDGLVLQGRRIIDALNAQEPGRVSDSVNSQLMNFENNVYRIDEFLDRSMGKSNLAEIQRQMALARKEKEQAVIFLRFSLIAAILMGLIIAFSVYRRMARERSYRQQIFDRMVNLEENERKKLSTAVHDEMGQDLSALKIYLGLISQQADNIKDDLKIKLEECRSIASGLIEKSHNISFLLRPPELDEVGLMDSLESLLLEAKHLTGIDYSFQRPDEKFEFPPERSLLLYRISQELLTNMAKHAQAKNVVLRINKVGESIELFYYDDGKGFDSAGAGVNKKLSRRREDKFGLGLLGLRERVELLGGKINIDSSIGKGATIIVSLPL